MPPCIKNMYESHMNNHTHFKNDERLKFFWWSFKASIPLEIVMDMWTVMLDNDTAIPQREREAVKREGKNLYLKHQRSRESGNEYNYFGCVKMASYCPFVNTQPSASQSIGDIEDLGKEIRDRKIHCGNNLWEKKTPVHSTGLAVKKWPDRHLRIWSPMTATAVLANYYLNKI
jgi:nucleotidyltransferase/DNA polymerase involved in DNA repair